MSHVVITGGNGFIGRHITALFREKGVDIRHPDHKSLDILDLPALNAAFQGADAVIHNAALVRDWGRRARFFDINVTGTENVLRACLKNRVRHVIVTGSCSVFGETHQTAPRDEASPRESHYPYFLDRVFPCAMNHYRDSKKEATQTALAFARARAMNLTVLHPVWVYGEGELHTGFLAYLKTVQSGVPAIMGRADNLFHVIYAADLAAAYYAAFARFSEGEGVREYLLGNPEPVRMEQLYRLFCAAAGLEKPRHLPRALIYPFALLFEAWATLTRAPEAPLLTRGRVNLFYDSIVYATEKAAHELGFTAQTPLAEGIRNTVRWYRQEGLL
ncbi:MAG: NAD-dependent epimerase/dehydratase family protein [Zoogloeaceae bacterium]|jgi:nucleoside-diphosphate-sugar epimerase|nr:NAD-dependent epimerase/dehydratase family protein [Zoogloeaceae bacterium]